MVIYLELEWKCTQRARFTFPKESYSKWWIHSPYRFRAGLQFVHSCTSAEL